MLDMKLLNFGSLNLDFVYRVDRFVRPGETKTGKERQVHLGGKGLNQSIALAKAGAKVWHAGCIGKDGEPLRHALQEAGVDTTFVKTLNCPTGHAVIQVEDSGQNCILLFGGANQMVEEAYVKEVLSAFDAGDVLLLQNETSATPFIIDLAHEKGMKIALNPSPMDASILTWPLHKLTWLILNEGEGADLAGDAAVPQILAILKERYPHLAIALTLGKDGVIHQQGDEQFTHGIYDVPVVDTTAAGDTFTGYFLAGVLKGLPMAEVLTLASVASSLSVSKLGAAASIPTLEEVKSANLPPMVKH